MDKTFVTIQTQIPPPAGNISETDATSHVDPIQGQLVVPINILPATPTTDFIQETKSPMEDLLSGNSREKKMNGLRVKRSLSVDRGDSSMSKKEKVQQILKNRVHKGRAGITAVSRKIGHGVSKHHQLRRTNSTPGMSLPPGPVMVLCTTLQTNLRFLTSQISMMQLEIRRTKHLPFILVAASARFFNSTIGRRECHHYHHHHHHHLLLLLLLHQHHSKL